MSKMSLEFDGFQQVLARLEKLQGDVRGTTEKALTETHSIVTKKAEEAIRPHHATGDTEKSLVRSANIKWSGTLASVETGFNIKEGGLPSIFLMYGTPRMKKDQKLYNAFYGSGTQNEVKKAQEEIFYNAIRRAGG